MRRVAALLLVVVLAAPGALSVAATGIPTCFDHPATIFGESGTITGTGSFDVIVGSEGPDTIRAGSGNDLVRGGGGDDRIFGVDDVTGGQAGDVVLGGAGSGRLFDLLGFGGMQMDRGWARDACDLHGTTTHNARRCKVVIP